MANDATSYLESSFLEPLLGLKGVTDISYNGDHLFYVSNVTGRKKSVVEVTPNEVGAFLRQLANLTERPFSYSYPLLDVSFGRYRLNAVFTNLARYNNQKTYSFSLRLASKECAIAHNEEFFGGNSLEILLKALQEEKSVVIGGQTSSGKTELEKWLLLHLADNRRVIVIDNVEELDMLENPKIDLTTWISNDLVHEGDFSSLVKNALRNNPDYIVLAEARGKEMLDALVSVMSGHPIITTVHAQNIEALPERMARLAMLASERLYLSELVSDIEAHISMYVYVKKEEKEGKIHRYIDKIASFNVADKKMDYLYQRGTL